MTKKMDRTKGIGGSDIHQVLNLEPYGCARRLWYEKRGIEPNYPPQDNAHMARGRFYEPIVAKLYQKRTKCKFAKSGEFISNQYPFLVGHPDRVISETGSPLEIKCPSLRNFKKIQREGVKGIPDYSVLQLLYYIYLLDAETGEFAIFCTGDAEVAPELLTFKIPRDQALIDKIVEASKEFWSMVLNALTPNRLEMTDKRCRVCYYRHTCWGADVININELPEASAIERELRYDLTGLVQEYQQAKSIEKEAGEYVNDIACRLKKGLGDARVVDIEGARVYHRPYEQFRIDTKALKAKYPEIAKEFEVKQIVTPLKVYSI